MSVLKKGVYVNEDDSLWASNQLKTPIFVSVPTITNFSLGPTSQAPITYIPIPTGYTTGDTIYFRIQVNVSGLSVLTPGILEFSVAPANEDNESSGDINIFPVFIGFDTSIVSLSMPMTTQLSSSAVNMALRLRNRTDDDVGATNIQFNRCSFQLVSSL